MSIEGRIAKFQRAMLEKDVEAAVLLATRDIYYYSGTAQQGMLLIPAQGEPVLLVVRDYQIARSESCLSDIRPASSFTAIRNAIVEKGLARGVIGIAQDVMPATTYQRLIGLLPDAKLADISRPMRLLSMIKDADEIAKTRQAAAIVDRAHEATMEILRPGISELEAAVEIELSMVRDGHDGYCVARNLADNLRFAGIASGDGLFVAGAMPITIPNRGSSPLVPYGVSHRKLLAGDAVVADLCGAFGGYIADETRTYTLGKATQGQREVTEAVKYVIEETLPLLKPGAVASEIFYAAKAAADRTPFAAYFLGGEERNVRFVGHGIGLELDEPPVLAPGDNTILEPGMVIAYEPIISAPGIGASSLETSVLITNEGSEVLTKRPIRLIEL
ncbi:MAG: aminopeptidase P family protein [Chloroflexi bacterium]|nr:aminopeptidase P family protein [Chloroflexota bacterium]